MFCQFLHGEGDFVRHLKKMGYVVKHVQSYIGAFFIVHAIAIIFRFVSFCFFVCFLFQIGSYNPYAGSRLVFPLIMFVVIVI